MKAVRRSEIVEVCAVDDADPTEWGIIDGHVRDRYGNPLPAFPGSFLVRDSFGVTVVNADTYSRCFAEIGSSELSFATDSELKGRRR